MLNMAMTGVKVVAVCVTMEDGYVSTHLPAAVAPRRCRFDGDYAGGDLDEGILHLVLGQGRRGAGVLIMAMAVGRRRINEWCGVIKGKQIHIACLFIRRGHTAPQLIEAAAILAQKPLPWRARQIKL